ncbi:PTS sugar transporter subunit IIA [Streptomyces sp. CCM_MD2014]|uniref:PTS sugar transporter subunit IIA n=1 Tax=Streptomyces sp. CCM_MD2014 TaxID=1561022 RepID=UPI000B32ABAF|nr:PTS sugar transporter subunit IIA [Streptomyces sp. CCM_MD2014]
MSALTDLLSADGIRLDVEAEDWRSAVRASGQVLVDEGISAAEYTEAMVRNVEENGPCIVLAPGFALARTRPFEAVLKTGMSWVRLASPVAFGHETKDPVHLAGTRNTDRVLGGEAYDRGVHAFGHEEPGPRRDVAAFGGDEIPRGNVLPRRGRGAPRRGIGHGPG